MTLKKPEEVPIIQSVKIKAGSPTISFRKPNLKDGKDIWSLIKETDVLDLNSSYSYILWCDKFSDSSIVAVKDGDVVGYVQGFVHDTPEPTLFVWQVAVSEKARGEGLATRMIQALLKRTKVAYLEATVTPSNIPSNGLFQSLARKYNSTYEIRRYIEAEDFPSIEDEEEEKLYRIGPIK